jgi:hypothetical protein
VSTLFDSWKKAIGEVYSPQQTGSFKTTWGVPVEGDPDVEAAKDYPDLRGFPNPDRSIDPFTGPDPWYSFSMAFDWRPFPDQMRHAVLVGKHDALRVNLCGLDPFEFIHQQQVRFFYKSEKNYKIVVAAYPLMTPAKPGVAESMGTKKAFTVSPIWGEYKVMDYVFEMGDAVFATYQDACFRTAIALVRRYLMICTLPPPPACPNAGCKKFARYKSLSSP